MKLFSKVITVLSILTGLTASAKPESAIGSLERVITFTAVEPDPSHSGVDILRSSDGGTLRYTINYYGDKACGLMTVYEAPNGVDFKTAIQCYSDRPRYSSYPPLTTSKKTYKRLLAKTANILDQLATLRKAVSHNCPFEVTAKLDASGYVWFTKFDPPACALGM